MKIDNEAVQKNMHYPDSAKIIIYDITGNP